MIALGWETCDVRLNITIMKFAEEDLSISQYPVNRESGSENTVQVTQIQSGNDDNDVNRSSRLHHPFADFVAAPAG